MGDSMKYVCFCEEIPAIIGSKKGIHRMPRKYTQWLARVYMYIFTKKVS